MVDSAPGSHYANPDAMERVGGCMLTAPDVTDRLFRVPAFARLDTTCRRPTKNRLTRSSRGRHGRRQGPGTRYMQ